MAPEHPLPVKQEHLGSSTGRGNHRDNAMVARLEKQLQAAQRRCDSLQAQLAQKATVPRATAAKRKAQEEAAARAEASLAKAEAEATVASLEDALERLEAEKAALLDYVQEAEAAKESQESQTRQRIQDAAESAGFKAAASVSAKTKAAEAANRRLESELESLQDRLKNAELLALAVSPSGKPLAGGNHAKSSPNTEVSPPPKLYPSAESPDRLGELEQSNAVLRKEVDSKYRELAELQGD